VSKAKVASKGKSAPVPRSTGLRQKHARAVTKPIRIDSSSSEGSNDDDDDNDNDLTTKTSNLKVPVRKAYVGVPPPKRKRVESNDGADSVSGDMAKVLLALGEVHELHTRQAVLHTKQAAAISKLAEVIRAMDL
jgi:hypothetical protein